MDDSISTFNEDMLPAAWAEYQREIESRCPNDYEVYLPNMTKLMSTYTFLSQLVAAHGGEIEDLKFDRRETNGGVTAYFTVLYLVGEDLVQFCDLIRGAHALSIDSLVDGSVCISMTFKDVFRKVK